MRPTAAHSVMLTVPAAEPVSLAEAKAHLRVDGTDEDALITALITVARERIEHETRRALVKQQWKALIAGDVRDGLPVELPRPRVLAADFVLEYRDADDDWQPSTDYLLQETREPALLWVTATPADIGTPLSCQDAVWRATYYAGYGETAADVPGPLRHAVMMLTAHLFERREVAISGATITEIPKSLDWLLDSYRVPWEGAVK